MIDNPNAGRGPWCAICGVEMSRPNHRFQACVNYEQGFESYRYHGGAVKSGFSPICGEGCLSKAMSNWASPPRPAPKTADAASEVADLPVQGAPEPLPAAGAVRIPSAPYRTAVLQRGTTRVAPSANPRPVGSPQTASDSTPANARLDQPRPKIWSRAWRAIFPGSFAPGY